MSNSSERIQVESRAEWRAWLDQNYPRTAGIWLVTFKKHIPEKHLPYADIVEEALCFGWVDSLPRKLDGERSMLWLAPRKPGSAWSKLNKERVARLTALGLMAPPGLERVAAAQKDGSWNALDEVDALVISPDLEAALSAFSKARQNYEAFPRSVKRGILEWIQQAKTPETRAKRITETARLAEDNLRANQWRK